MYTCERCGTKFARQVAVSEDCPRCLAREGVQVALAFRLFEQRPVGQAGSRPPGGVEEAVRRGLISGAR